MYLGLRPEPLAVRAGHHKIGLALVDAGCDMQKRPRIKFTGFLLIFLGGSAAPRVTLFVAAISIYVGYRAWRAAVGARERRRVAAWWFGAMLVAMLVFLQR